MKLFALIASSLLAWTAAGCLGLAARAQTPAVAPAAARATCPVVLQYKFLRLQDETPQDLCQYAGKVVLVVNTASFCGYTSQYEGLEALYAKYQRRGLVVLGFPSNDFGEQEPGSSKEIADFCFNTYGVKFPMFSKLSAAGADIHPLYKFLTEKETNPNFAGKINWNFNKFLIDKNGNPIARFDSADKPESAKVTQAIEQALK